MYRVYPNNFVHGGSTIKQSLENDNLDIENLYLKIQQLDEYVTSEMKKRGFTEK